MSILDPRDDEQVIAFETFAVSIAVRADPSVLPRLDGLAPVPSRPCDPETVRHRISIRAHDDGRYDVRYDVRDGEELGPRDHTAGMIGDADLDLAIASLDAHVQSAIGLHAPDHTFINAGVVAYRDGAILLPGEVLSGKRTLVAALVKAGCVRYSDDYAVIDNEGLVVPYLRPKRPGNLHMPVRNGGSPDYPAESALPPLPIAAVVSAPYWPDSGWNPRRLTPGEAVLALVSRAEAVSERPDGAFQAITVALGSEPVAFEGNRGEAHAVAPLLLAQLERELAGRVS